MLHVVPFDPARHRRARAARGALVLLLGLLGAAGGARADDPAVVRVTIRDHRFVPAELRVPAGKPFTIEVHNEDPTAEEFESSSLKVEKVIAGGTTASIRVRALEKGRYSFIGEYHEDTASGAVVAE